MPEDMGASLPSGCAPPGSAAGGVVVVGGSAATALLLRLAISRPDRRADRTE